MSAFDLEISSELESEALVQCCVDRTDTTLLEQYREKHYRGLVAVLEMMVES